MGSPRIRAALWTALAMASAALPAGAQSLASAPATGTAPSFTPGVRAPAASGSTSLPSPLNAPPSASVAPAIVPAAVPVPLPMDPPGMGPESPMLTELRQAERERDPAPANVAEGATLAGTSLPDGLDASFASRIQLPSLPLRVTPRIARQLALYRTDPRARRAMTSWLRHAARYRARIEAILASEGVPVELVWVAAAESDFNPQDSSSAGAVGVWQLMPEAARSYGLRVDAWVDERRDVERSTHAAARYLRDLHARFGAWDLALAAYNMGYNGLLRAIRKYNTNDFEALAQIEAGLPWETAHYAPRILSAAVAAHNATLFAFTGLAYDPAVQWEDLPVARSVPLDELARAANVEPSVLRALNPALLRTRTPAADAQASFVLHVPLGARARAALALETMSTPPTRAYRARHGETLEEIAARYGITASQLLALSGLPGGRRVAPGTDLLVPAREPSREAPRERPTVALAEPAGSVPAGRRVFYRVGLGDELPAVARALGVHRDELVRWNGLDPTAHLQSGMWLQVYLTGDAPDARVWEVAEVDVIRRGSEEFLDRAVALEGRVRMRVAVREGDTMESIARRYSLSVGSLARINRRSRHAELHPGELVVVYTDPDRVEEDTASTPSSAASEPATAAREHGDSAREGSARSESGRSESARGESSGSEPAPRASAAPASEVHAPSPAPAAEPVHDSATARPLARGNGARAQ